MKPLTTSFARMSALAHGKLATTPTHIERRKTHTHTREHTHPAEHQLRTKVARTLCDKRALTHFAPCHISYAFAPRKCHQSIFVCVYIKLADNLVTYHTRTRPLFGSTMYSYVFRVYFFFCPSAGVLEAEFYEADVDVIPITFPFATSHIWWPINQANKLNIQFDFRSSRTTAVLAYGEVTTSEGNGFWEVSSGVARKPSKHIPHSFVCIAYA